MPRAKRQRLKQRSDGRFACRYKNLWFYGASEDEALQARDEYKRLEKSGAFNPQKAPTIAEYALKWLPREKAKVVHQTYAEAATLLEKLLDAIGDKRFDEVKGALKSFLMEFELCGKKPMRYHAAPGHMEGFSILFDE